MYAFVRYESEYNIGLYARPRSLCSDTAHSLALHYWPVPPLPLPAPPPPIPPMKFRALFLGGELANNTTRTNKTGLTSPPARDHSSSRSDSAFRLHQQPLLHQHQHRHLLLQLRLHLHLHRPQTDSPYSSTAGYS